VKKAIKLHFENEPDRGFAQKQKKELTFSIPLV